MIILRKTVDITGVKVDSVTMQEALERLKYFLQSDNVNTIFTPNAEIMMQAYRDNELREILNSADMVVADGAGVVLASKIIGRPVPEKVSGFDLVKNSFSLDINRKIRYFLLGGKPGIAEEAGKAIISQYANADIAGQRHGYFSKQDEAEIIEQINSSNADILLVALGAPKQEKWIYANKNKLKVKVCIGVGGTLDVLAGKACLAPEFMRKNGLEWLYRLFKEPWRYKRMLDLPRYMIIVIFARLGLGKQQTPTHP